MKVKITAQDFAYPVGTVVEVGDAAPAGWAGKCEPVDPLDHDGDGTKGGSPKGEISTRLRGGTAPIATTSPVDGRGVVTTKDD